MPKRIVDGEGVWRSKKLKMLRVSHRAEYANLLPLAEANGVFDADPDRVWSDVYSFNRPDVSVETVTDILDDLERVGLLKRWACADKTWGYWVGIDKSGRLPKSHLDRYRNLPPGPPEEVISYPGLIRDNPGVIQDSPGLVLLGIGSGIGSGIGIGTGTEPAAQTEINPEGEDMKADKQIDLMCHKHFGRKANLSKWHIEDIRRLEAAHKGSSVARAFEEWAAANSGDIDITDPVAMFLRVSDDYLETSTPAKQAIADPELLTLVVKLVRVCDKLNFGDRERVRLSAVRAQFTDDEILEGLKGWLDTQDFTIPKTAQYAAKNFVEVADQRAMSVRLDRQERVAEVKAREIHVRKMQEAAEAERREEEEARRKEEEEFNPLAEMGIIPK